ncbi:MAG: Holliday junction resolvase RuvX [Granulosicoccus sp.]
MPDEQPGQTTAQNDFISGTCLAFDFGSKRIGTAVGESRLQTAQPLGIIVNTNGTPDWQAVDALLEQWKPSHLVVGWPLTESGEEQSITSHVKGFIKRLQNRYALPVHKADERFSSVAAQQELKRLRQSGQRKRKTNHADVDTIAAALILESWFNMKTSK